MKIYPWQKKLFLILFIITVTLNFCVITFGFNFDFIHNLRDDVRKLSLNAVYSIEDIATVNTINNIPMDKDYYIDVYEINGNSNSLRFENLTPNIYSLVEGEKSSMVRSVIFDDDLPHIGILRVTSTVDASFLKDLELTFSRIYEKDLNITINRVDGIDVNNNYKIYKGCNIYFYIPFTNRTTEREITYDYDTEYFECINKNCFKPIKTGYSSIKFSYSDKKDIIFNFDCLENEVFEFDELKFYDYPFLENEQTELNIGSPYVVFPIKNGTKVYIPFEIQSSDNEVLNISNINVIRPLKEGKVTLSFNSEYGNFEKEIEISSDRLVLKPYLFSRYVDNNNPNLIHASVNDKSSISLIYSSIYASHDVTLIYDETYCDVSYSGNNDSATLTICGKKVGDIDLELIYAKDTSKEMKLVYKISIDNKRTWENIEEIVVFIVKGLSHILLFLILGISTALFMIYSINEVNKYFKLFFGVFFGLFVGGLEESIQYFIPDRFGTILDAFVYDWVSYLFGLVFTYLIFMFVYYLINRRRNKRVSNA